MTARLIDQHLIDDARDSAPRAVAAYRDYVTIPGADLARVRADLEALIGPLRSVGLDDAADEAAHVLADLPS